jgi:hypothetical protein
MYASSFERRRRRNATFVVLLLSVLLFPILPSPHHSYSTSDHHSGSRSIGTISTPICINRCQNTIVKSTCVSQQETKCATQWQPHSVNARPRLILSPPHPFVGSTLFANAQQESLSRTLSTSEEAQEPVYPFFLDCEEDRILEFPLKKKKNTTALTIAQIPSNATIELIMDHCHNVSLIVILLHSYSVWERNWILSANVRLIVQNSNISNVQIVYAPNRTQQALYPNAVTTGYVDGSVSLVISNCTILSQPEGPSPSAFYNAVLTHHSVPAVIRVTTAWFTAYTANHAEVVLRDITNGYGEIVHWTDKEEVSSRQHVAAFSTLFAAGGSVVPPFGDLTAEECGVFRRAQVEPECVCHMAQCYCYHPKHSTVCSVDCRE